ncbi:hypothetical protein BC940DRAFT_291927 [Gongronella butleri]|nr:hypothetical protein BC940DRAFT_291927 [Gongronella butleri]
MKIKVWRAGGGQQGLIFCPFLFFSFFFLTMWALIDNVDHPFAVCILASYFVLIALLVWRIVPVLTRPQGGKSACFYLFLLLATGALGATWYYMFRYFEYSFWRWTLLTTGKENGDLPSATLNSVSHWLYDTSLFDEAWRSVCQGEWAWLWSVQICSFTVAVWMPLMAIEGSRRHIPATWAFMLLGQVVAISVSAALFFAAMLLYTDKTTKKGTNGSQNVSQNGVARRFPETKHLAFLLLFCVTAAAWTTVRDTPNYTRSPYFLTNLLIMHGLLVIPLALTLCLPRLFSTMHGSLVVTLYTSAAAANLVLVIVQWHRAIFSLLVLYSNLPAQEFIMLAAQWLFNTFFSHPAQSSISSDAAALYPITIAWIAIHQKQRVATTIAFAVLTLIATPAVALPLYLAYYETRRECAQTPATKKTQ